MDYESAINFIRDERLDMVEYLSDLKEQLLETLLNLPPATALDHEISGVIDSYCRIRDDIMAMVESMNVLEKDLIVAYQTR